MLLQTSLMVFEHSVNGFESFKCFIPVSSHVIKNSHFGSLESFAYK